MHVFAFIIRKVFATFKAASRRKQNIDFLSTLINDRDSIHPHNRTIDSLVCSISQLHWWVNGTRFRACVGAIEGNEANKNRQHITEEREKKSEIQREGIKHAEKARQDERRGAKHPPLGAREGSEGESVRGYAHLGYGTSWRLFVWWHTKSITSSYASGRIFDRCRSSDPSIHFSRYLDDAIRVAKVFISCNPKFINYRTYISVFCSSTLAIAGSDKELPPRIYCPSTGSFSS